MSHLPSTLRRAGSVAVGIVLTGALVAGCSGGNEESEADPSPSTSEGPVEVPSSTPGSASLEAEPYLDVPAGVELTDQGLALQIGETATVAWEPRQGEIGALDIQVVRVDQTTFKESFVGWKLDATTKSTTPYFVRANLTNVGDMDLGERQVPLYLVDTNGTLIQPSRFQTRFTPCPSNPDFPAEFEVGASEKVCLVYLAPEGTQFRSVSFRPTQEFNPITWNGQATSIKKPQKKRNNQNRNDGGGGGQQDETPENQG